MTFSIDRAELADLFEPGEIAVAAMDRLAEIRHAPTRQFLHEVGIPLRENPWFEIDDISQEDFTTLGERYEDLSESYDNLPPNAAEWLVLGAVYYDDVAIDPASGEIYCIPEDAAEVYRLNKSIDAFVAFLYLLEKERPDYDFESEKEVLDLAGAVSRLNSRMREIDPEALAVPHSRWRDILEYVEEPAARH